VSRIPIRERSDSSRPKVLVTFNPHRGAIVSSLSLDEIEEVFDLRASIESDLMRRAIPHLTDAPARPGRRVLDRYAVALRTGDVAKWGCSTGSSTRASTRRPRARSR
jgi:DNA-binding GntR family transcriptional regulator